MVQYCSKMHQAEGYRGSPGHVGMNWLTLGRSVSTGLQTAVDSHGKGSKYKAVMSRLSTRPEQGT